MKVLSNCFKNELKQIHFLTLDEMDVVNTDQNYFLELLASMQGMDELEHVSFSKIDMRHFEFKNNEVPLGLVKLVNTLPELHALSLCHCDLTTDEIKVLCRGFGVPQPTVAIEE